MSQWLAEVHICQFIHPTGSQCKDAAHYKVYDGAFDNGKYTCRQHLERSLDENKTTHLISTIRNGDR